MGDARRHHLRPLGEGESGVPQRAWIEYPDGREQDCALHRKGARLWEARPPQPVVLEPGCHLRLDRLMNGGRVRFVDVLAPDSPPGQ